MSTAIESIPLVRIDGTPGSLGDYAGKVRLIVNVASKCGLTPQYAGLESLYQARKDQGLEILGFPANNFREQEPGTNEDIAQFCSLNYDVHFPLFAKIDVVGEHKHPLYQALTAAQGEAVGEGPHRERLKGFGIPTNDPPEVLWNFEKFLVSRSGEVVGRFAPDVTAEDPRLAGAIEAELAKV